MQLLTTVLSEKSILSYVAQQLQSFVLGELASYSCDLVSHAVHGKFLVGKNWRIVSYLPNFPLQYS